MKTHRSRIDAVNARLREDGETYFPSLDEIRDAQPAFSVGAYGSVFKFTPEQGWTRNGTPIEDDEEYQEFNGIRVEEDDGLPNDGGNLGYVVGEAPGIFDGHDGEALHRLAERINDNEPDLSAVIDPGAIMVPIWIAKAIEDLDRAIIVGGMDPATGKDFTVVASMDDFKLTYTPIHPPEDDRPRWRRALASIAATLRRIGL